LKKAANSIGTKKESSLHRELKTLYSGPQGMTEVAAAGYIADGLNGEGEFIEVQTGSFAPLKRKLKALLLEAPVRLVYPVAAAKYIEVFELFNGTVFLLHRRKSPRRGSPWDLFNALVYGWELASLQGLSIELVLADIVERRVADGKGSWRRRGQSILDKSLEAVRESIVLERPADYLRFVPFARREAFTASMLAKKAGIKAALARKALYVLTRLGLVKRAGKKGRAWLYERV